MAGDFARGPGQAVSIPLTVSDASAAQPITLDYDFDPTFLTINGISAGLRNTG